MSKRTSEKMALRTNRMTPTTPMANRGAPKTLVKMSRKMELRKLIT